MDVRRHATGPRADAARLVGLGVALHSTGGQAGRYSRGV